VGALQRRLGVSPKVCLHVGDQFSSIGNDFAARHATPTLWVAGPKETQHIIKRLLERRGVSTKQVVPAMRQPSLRKVSVWSCPSPSKAGRGAADEPDGSATEAHAEEPGWVRG